MSVLDKVGTGDLISTVDIVVPDHLGTSDGDLVLVGKVGVTFANVGTVDFV